MNTDGTQIEKKERIDDESRSTFGYRHSLLPFIRVSSVFIRGSVFRRFSAVSVPPW
jgi:hypothetical protein